MARQRHAGGMLLALCALGLAISPTSLEIRGGYPILKDVFVNGKGPYRMLLDTGMQTTSLRPSVAASAGIRPTFSVELQNALGSTMTPGGTASSMESGKLALDEVEVLIAEPPQVAAIGPLDGVLGQSFLARANYWLDYAAKRLIWDPHGDLERCLEGERLTLSMVDGRPALEANFPGTAAQGKRLVLDTGASHVILYGWPEGKSGVAAVRTTNGAGTARLARIEALSVGGLSWRGLSAGVLETNGSSADGLLPGRLLKSFYVSNRRRYVLAGPRVSGRCASGPAEPLARRGGATGKAW